MLMMEDTKIRQLCPNADNITISDDGINKSIGIKVGVFSMGTSISMNMPSDVQREKVRNLYMDLVMMNQREDQQRKEAAEEARGQRN